MRAYIKVKKYEVESLLRPVVEFNSVIILMVFSVFLYFAPGIILMTPPVAHGAALMLALFAVYRFLQGYGILRYKKGLKRLPYYSLSSNKIPVSNKKLFLGKGFRWSAKHVERMRDINSNDPDKVLAQSKFYRLARWMELKFENKKILGKLVLAFSINSFLNPVRPLPPVGGSIEIHAVGMYEGERDIYEDIGERVGHKLVIGTTRVGKTRLAEIFITQDIKRGDVTVVVDPKGDAELMRRVYSEAKKEGRPVYIFHLGYPDISARYNPIGEFSNITEVAGRIANQLPSEGNSSAFKMFAWRFVNIVSQSLVKLGERPDYNTISQHIFAIDKLFVRYGEVILKEQNIKDWKNDLRIIKGKLNDKTIPRNMIGRDLKAVALMQYFDDSKIYDKVLEGLLGAFRYDKTFFDKIVSSLAPLLEQLTSGRNAELLSPSYLDMDDKRPIFDWKSVIQQKAVVYIGLDCLSDPIVGSAVGASMIADLTSTAGYLYKHGMDHGQAVLKDKQGKEIRNSLPKTSLHLDELEAVLGPEFIPMVNRSGGAGFQVTAYTQTAADILSGIGGDAAKAGVIQGNFNTLLMMRVKTKETADILTSQLPEVQVASLTAVTSAGDSSDVNDNVMFTSGNEDRITKESAPMLTTSDLTSLPKGQAFALIEGGQLYKLRLPLPSNDDDLPLDLEEMAKDMSLKHGTNDTPEDWYSSKDYGWYDERPLREVGNG